MKKLIILAALLFSGYAQAQVAPVPFNSVSNGGFVSADAGFFGTLNVLGTATIPGLTIADQFIDGGLTVQGPSFHDGGLTVAGQTVLDGGLYVTGQLVVDGGAARADGIQANKGGGLCFGEDDATTAYGFASGPCDADGRWPNANALFYWDTSQIYIETVGGGGIGFTIGGSLKLNIVTATTTISNALNLSSTLQVGSGAVLSNLSGGHCTLGTPAAGLCIAPVPGNQGTSYCVASVQGTSQTLVGCDAQPDAGSAVVYCQSTATGT